MLPEYTRICLGTSTLKDGFLYETDLMSSITYVPLHKQDKLTALGIRPSTFNLFVS